MNNLPTLQDSLSMFERVAINIQRGGGPPPSIQQVFYAGVATVLKIMSDAQGLPEAECRARVEAVMDEFNAYATRSMMEDFNPNLEPPKGAHPASRRLH